MKATLSNYHQSPRKVRLVIDLIRGKSIADARAALQFLPKKSAPAIEKLLSSAVANARGAGMTPDNLFVKNISVDKGYVMRRYRPFARGRAGAVRKTMSIVRMELGTRAASPKAAKKSSKKTPKKKETVVAST